MNIGEVLGKPFKIIWKNSNLWGLGMIAQIIPTIVSVLATVFVLSNPELISLYSVTSQAARQAQIANLEQLFSGIGWQSVLPTFVAVFLGFLGAGFLSFLISEYIRCCIIRGAAKADEKIEGVRFGEILKQGWISFGKLLLQDLFFGVIFIILFSLVIIAVIGAAAGSSNSSVVWIVVVLLCCGLCLLLPLGLFLNILLNVIKVSLVHDNIGVFSSIGRGWLTFKKAFGWLLLLGIILPLGAYALSWITNAIFSLSQSLNVLSSATGTFPVLTTTRFILLGLSSLVGFFISSYVTTYSLSAWTIAYRRINYPAIVQPVVPPMLP